MARPTQIVCDVCGAVKREANHWWYILIDEPWPGALTLIESPDKPQEVGLDLCSEQCVHATVSKYMRGELKP
jgi:hypothetical protein